MENACCHNTRYEYVCAAPVQWEMSIENSQSHKSVQYKVYTVRDEDRAWLTLSRTDGYAGPPCNCFSAPYSVHMLRWECYILDAPGTKAILSTCFEVGRGAGIVMSVVYII